MNEPLLENEYRCEMCNGVFEKGKSDEEALAEKNEFFPDEPEVDCVTVCDDCWQHIRPDTHSEQYRQYKEWLSGYLSN